MGMIHSATGFFQHSNRHSNKRTSSSKRACLSVEHLETRDCPAPLTIQLNYDYDTYNFYTPQRRAIMQKAADTLGNLIDDNLAAIVPSGSNSWNAVIHNPSTEALITFQNPVIEANTIIVFLGSRPIDGPGGTLGWGGTGGWSWSGTTTWGNLVAQRGKPANQFSTWGGRVILDSTDNWHEGETTAGLDISKNDLFSVAIHEMGHALGVEHLQEGTVDPEGFEAAMDPTIFQGTRKLFNKADLDEMAVTGWGIATDTDATRATAAPVVTDTSNWTATALAEGTRYQTNNFGLEDPLDVDLFRVPLQAGQTLTVSTAAPLTGNGPDTYLRLFNASGGEIAENDNFNGTYSQIRYEATTNGTYYFSVSSFPNTEFSIETAFSRALAGETGDYAVTVDIESITEGGNHFPVANDDDVNADSGRATVIDVLLNDSDPDDDPISISSYTNGAKGTVEVADGKIVYTANEGVLGTDSFTYTISDGNGRFATATVTVTLRIPLLDVSELQEQYGFYFTGDYSFNVHKHNEKWFKDRWGRWTALTPDGYFHRWNDASFTSSPVIARANQAVYNNPNLLFNAEVSLSEEDNSQLTKLREDEGFHFVGSYHFNVHGFQEKWLQDRWGDWHAITPDGDIKKWNEDSLDTSAIIATVNPLVYDDPNRLFDAEVSIPSNIVDLLIELRRDEGFYFTGDYQFDVHGNDEKWFKNRDGDWFSMTPDGVLYQWDDVHLESNPTGDELNPLVFDDLNLLFDAPITLPDGTETQLKDLQSDHGFHFVGSFHHNVHGQEEKWFQDRFGKWFAITPDGAIKEWNDDSLDTSTEIATVSEFVYDDPHLLFNAPAEPPPEAQQVLANLQDTNEFRMVFGSLHFNVHGSREKWFQDKLGRWFALTPDGLLKLWDENSLDTSFVFDVVHALAYDDPVRWLFNA